jgi:hypothetical protein
MVDFNVRGFAGLNLDHHFGQSTPAELRHDLATGVALDFLRAGGGSSPSHRGVTIDHYDTDGVLSVFCLLRPELALPHAALLLDAARTGDFFEKTGDAGARVSLALQDDIQERSVAQPRSARLAWSFAEAMRILPPLIESPERVAECWEPRLERLHEELVRLAGEDAVEEAPAEALSIVRLERGVSDTAAVTATSQPVILSVRRVGHDVTDYDAWVRMRLSWGYERACGPDAVPIHLTSCARRLQIEERRVRGEAQWTCDEYDSIGWRVRASRSRLPEAQVRAELARAIRRRTSPARRRRDPTLGHRLATRLSGHWARVRPLWPRRSQA